MSFDVSEAVLRVADSVRRRFRRKRNPADPDDVAQEAALHALEAVQAGRVDLAGPNPHGYLYRAAVRETGLSTSRWLAKVSISEGQAKNARRFQYAATPDEAKLAERDGGERPDARLARVESARERRRWSLSRARILDGYASGLDELDRKIVRLLLGFGDEPAPDGGAAEVAARFGVDVARVRRAVTALRREAFGDFALHKAMRNIVKTEDR